MDTIAQPADADSLSLPPGTKFVDAFVIDINGIPRGKRLAAAEWRGPASQVAFSASALVLDARGHAQGPLGLGTEDGDPDAFGTPVPGRIVPVPWAQANIAQSLLSMRTENGPLWFDSRQILAGIVARCNADGLFPVVACELEFYLLTIGADGAPTPRRRPPAPARTIPAISARNRSRRTPPFCTTCTPPLRPRASRLAPSSPSTAPASSR